MAPTPDELEDVILSARFGELDEIKAFVEKYGATTLSEARDESGNSVLHMTCANGHQDILEYLLPIMPPSLLSAQNSSGSTPLHWATLNEQIDTMKTLVAHPSGPKSKLIDIKNNAGRTPLGEAEMAGWDAGASWLVSVMDLDENAAGAAEGTTDEVVEEGDVQGEEGPLEIHVEVEDAQGGISKMTIGGDGKPVSSDTSVSTAASS
ncbi:cytoplasmic protein [Clavulina sp. PMI_390]|nr:cytoplasmic protein [Clavulina sp. PMI_390]